MGATKSTSPQKGLMEAQQITITMPDRSRPGITTTAHPTGGNQGGDDKYATGANPNPNPNKANPAIKLPKRKDDYRNLERANPAPER